MSSSPVELEASVPSGVEANSMVLQKKKSKAKARRTALREAQRGALRQWAMKKGSPGDRISKQDGIPAAPKSWGKVVAEVARLHEAAAELEKARINQEGSLASVNASTESSGLPTLDMIELVNGELAEEREKYSTAQDGTLDGHDKSMSVAEWTDLFQALEPYYRGSIMFGPPSFHSTMPDKQNSEWERLAGDIETFRLSSECSTERM